jgi:cysteine-rich repeat protein
MHRTLVCWIALGSASCFDEATSPTGEGPTATETGTSSPSPTSTSSDVTATSEGSTADASDASDLDSSEVGTTSADSTGASPACGDGTVDDGEECDDGNAVDADGCNANCVASGRLLWQVRDGDIDEDAGRGIVVVPNGDVFAIGTVFVDGIHEDIWLASWSNEGEQRFSHDIDLDGESYERGVDITAGPGGLFLAITTEQGAAQMQASFDRGAHTEPQLLVGAEGVAFTPLAVAASASSYYVAGSAETVPSSPALVRLTQFFAPQWAVDDPVGDDLATYTGVAAVEGDRTVSCGVTGGGTVGFLQGRAADGTLEWTRPDLPRLRDVTIANDGEIIVVGTSFSPATQEDLHVARLLPDGSAQVWRRDIDGGGGADEQGRGVAIDVQGHITVAGNASGGEAFVVKLDGAGETRWTTMDGAAQVDGQLEVMDVAVSPVGDASIVGAVFGEEGVGDIFVAHFSR